jgi:hypothetical protein
MGRKVLPVRVARSALGLDIPCADLYVTKEHELLIDGVLVTAGSLINGTTITVRNPRELDEIEFFHIKLECHNAIYAEGAPCGTMRNVEESAVNFPEYLRYYGSRFSLGVMDPMQPFDPRCRKPAAGDKIDADGQDLAGGVKIKAPHVPRFGNAEGGRKELVLHPPALASIAECRTTSAFSKARLSGPVVACGLILRPQRTSQVRSDLL